MPTVPGDSATTSGWGRLRVDVCAAGHLDQPDAVHEGPAVLVAHDKVDPVGRRALGDDGRGDEAARQVRRELGKERPS